MPSVVEHVHFKNASAIQNEEHVVARGTEIGVGRSGDIDAARTRREAQVVDALISH